MRTLPFFIGALQKLCGYMKCGVYREGLEALEEHRRILDECDQKVHDGYELRHPIKFQVESHEILKQIKTSMGMYLQSSDLSQLTFNTYWTA